MKTILNVLKESVNYPEYKDKIKDECVNNSLEEYSSIICESLDAINSYSDSLVESCFIEEMVQLEARGFSSLADLSLCESTLMFEAEEEGFFVKMKNFIVRIIKSIITTIKGIFGVFGVSFKRVWTLMVNFVNASKELKDKLDKGVGITKISGTYKVLRSSLDMKSYKDLLSFCTVFNLDLPDTASPTLEKQINSLMLVLKSIFGYVSTVLGISTNTDDLDKFDKNKQFFSAENLKIIENFSDSFEKSSITSGTKKYIEATNTLSKGELEEMTFASASVDLCNLAKSIESSSEYVTLSKSKTFNQEALFKKLSDIEESIAGVINNVYTKHNNENTTDMQKDALNVTRECLRNLAIIYTKLLNVSLKPLMMNIMKRNIIFLGNNLKVIKTLSKDYDKVKV